MPHNNKDVTVLLVEDDEVDIMGVRRAFRQSTLDNNIIVANDGIEALALLRDADAVPRPYMVLLDMNMPRMGGAEFLESARKDPDLKNSIVFVLTTSKDPADKTRAYQHHPAGYIVKDRTDGNFINAVTLLEQYAKVVSFP
jgi:CheY-like chemotaxis protein